MILSCFKLSVLEYNIENKINKLEGGRGSKKVAHYCIRRQKI